jgi:formamidopyrimidine-DNA glycosylase
MPEGHTVHRLARDLASRLRGQRLRAGSLQGRFAAGAAALDGRVLDETEAHGKHLWLWFGGDALHVHLGRFGRSRIHALPAPEPSGALRLRLAGRAHAWDLRGPTTCEILDGAGVEAVRARLGPDPLRGDGDSAEVAARLRRRRSGIGAALLDQSVIAGLGNIYRAELLLELGLHPERRADSLTDAEVAALWETSARWLRLGVRRNRIVIPADDGAAATPGTGAEGLRVYKQEVCGRCDAPVSSGTSAGRAIWWCPACQV